MINWIQCIRVEFILCFKKYIDRELNASHVKEALANNLIDFEVEAGKLLPWNLKHVRKYFLIVFLLIFVGTEIC